MKKLLLTSLFVLLSVSLSAELYKPHRVVEVGVDAEGGFSNNYLAATEILVKDLVIDLQKMSNDVPDSGWNIDLYGKEKNFLNINAGTAFRLGFSAGVEACGNLNLSHDFFDFLSSGYSVGDTMKIDLDTYGDVFVTGSVSLGTRIKGLGIKLTPSYYVPVIYIPKTTGTVSCTTNEAGEIVAHAQADFSVYSAFDLSRFLEGDDYENVDDTELNQQIQESLSNGGFDFLVELEYPLAGSRFELGAFARVPLLPGKVSYKASRSISADFYQSNFLGVLNDESTSENSHDFGEFTYSAEEKKVYRPMRLGLEAVWRPLGSWLEIRPMGACVIRSPYVADERIIYPEYSLDANIKLKEILALSIGTAYLDQVFIQRAGFMLNARLFEVKTQLAMRSGSFDRSFMGAGLGAYLGVRMGF